MTTCRNCGHTYPDSNLPTPDHCAQCPPWECDQCQQPDSYDNPCKCWVSFAGLPLADIKGLLAHADLSVDQHGPHED